jgi:hypothetical protein
MSDIRAEHQRLCPQTPARALPLQDPSWNMSACISSQAHHIKLQLRTGSPHFVMPLDPLSRSLTWRHNHGSTCRHLQQGKRLREEFRRGPGRFAIFCFCWDPGEPTWVSGVPGGGRVSKFSKAPGGKLLCSKL